MVKIKTTIIYTIFLSSIAVCGNASVDDGVGQPKNGQQINAKSSVGVVSDENFYKDLLAKKQKELERQKKQENKKLNNQKEDTDETEQQADSWIYQNKSQMIKIVVVVMASVIVIMIGWKMYNLNL